MSRGGRKEKVELSEVQKLKLENLVLKKELECYKIFSNAVYRWVKTKDYLSTIENKEIKWWHLNYISNLVYNCRV